MCKREDLEDKNIAERDKQVYQMEQHRRGLQHEMREENQK